jgi:diguanylate cyclase (GGDEF)-like protein
MIAVTSRNGRSFVSPAIDRLRASFHAARLRHIVLLVCLLGMVLPGPTYAADRWSGLTTTVFRNYGRDQGLPHPVPTALAQDREGFIWIGTQGGLARWDGYRFKAYRADPGVAGSLPYDWIQTLHVDTGGRLWIGSSAGHLARYDGARDRFDLVPIGLAAGRIHIAAIVDDGAGQLWIGTDDGLRHLNPITGAFTILRAGMPDAQGLPDGPVLAVLRDRMGALWAGTANGLVRRAAGSRTFVAVPLAGVRTGVSALFEEPNGRIWIGTVRNGLFAIDHAGASPRAMGVAAAIAPNSVSSICLAGAHEIWAGLRSGGIVAVDTQTGAARAIRHDRTVSNSLAHDDVWALLRDNAGSVWVGGTGGLSYRPPDPGLISTIFGAQDRPGGLSAADVLSVFETRDRRIWLGYIDGGVDVIDPARGRVAALRPGEGHPDHTLPRDAVFAMAEADDGTVYLATRRGLYATDRTAKKVQLVALRGRDPHLAINALLLDAGALWIGGERDGLWAGVPSRVAPGGKVIFGPADAASLSNSNINVIVRGTGRDIWVGTRNGLNRVNLDTHRIEAVPPDPADKTALAGRFVSALLVDRKGRLWVGTFDGGLALMTGPRPDGRPSFRRFGLAEGLPHLNVDSLAMDGTGMIWAGTDDGLARIDPETLAIRAVGRPDGSVLRDYFVGARGTSREGEALFGAKDGFSVVRAGPLPRWAFRPPIVVTDLRVGGKFVPVGSLNGVGGKVEPIILTPESNSLTVEFAALDFTAPEKNRYAYRLDNFDRDWTETDSSRRLAAYTNLPPGDYTLHLRGTNREGQWDARDLVLPIRVMPAWYQHRWVAIAIAWLVILAVGALLRWRMAHLRRRQSELERQIAERTTDLRAANERLTVLTRTDTLTGCANRGHFVDGVSEFIAMANRHGTPLSLVVLDLDEFKKVNDTWGHPAGDATLAMTGRVLASHVRASDLCGRIGGEEFALAMPLTDAKGARMLAERLRAAIGGAAVDASGARIHVTASFGIAQHKPGEAFDSLYARADTALYAAKLAGRDRIEIEGATGTP